MDQSEQNGPNRANVDRIELMWTEWTELGRSGQNRTNVVQIESMWIEWTELDKSGLNKTKWAELDRIEPKQLL